MAAIVPVLANHGDASVTVSLLSTGAADTVTFAAISAVLPASAANSRIKAFLDAPRGSVALTLAALGTNGASLSLVSDVSGQGVPQVSADKTLAGYAAGNLILRISLAYSASN
jgi:hypothetical protein